MWTLFKTSFVKGLGYATAWEIVRNWRSWLPGLLGVVSVIVSLIYYTLKSLSWT